MGEPDLANGGKGGGDTVVTVKDREGIPVSGAVSEGALLASSDGRVCGKNSVSVGGLMEDSGILGGEREEGGEGIVAASGAEEGKSIDIGIVGEGDDSAGLGLFAGVIVEVEADMDAMFRNENA